MPAIELTEADNGRAVEVRRRDEIILRLPENATTGFRWQMQLTGDGIELFQDSNELGPNPKFGEGGIRKLEFRATDAGVVRIELKRLQAWEGDKSVDARFSINISVAG